MTLQSSTSLLYILFIDGLKVDIRASSEMTPKGRRATKLAQTLLNGNNICMVMHSSLISHDIVFVVLTMHFCLVGAWERWTRTSLANSTLVHPIPLELCITHDFWLVGDHPMALYLYCMYRTSQWKRPFAIRQMI
jgi:hypothetical protein